MVVLIQVGLVPSVRSVLQLASIETTGDCEVRFKLVYLTNVVQNWYKGLAGILVAKTTNKFLPGGRCRHLVLPAMRCKCLLDVLIKIRVQ